MYRKCTIYAETRGEMCLEVIKDWSPFGKYPKIIFLNFSAISKGTVSPEWICFEITLDIEKMFESLLALDKPSEFGH
jgi:hypothetical protein